MTKLFAKTNLSSWILAGAIAGVLAFPLLGNGGLPERFTPLAAVEDETDWTLAHVTETEEPDVDWTLANNEDKEDETDWTLA
jgi:hypothetical protein